jgi:hypothetical protein
VPVKELVIAGGLVKNQPLMQIYSDVTRLPLSTVSSAQAPALGSAIHAAVAAGSYANVEAASAAMGWPPTNVYTSVPENEEAYDALFSKYTALHDYFGRGGNDVVQGLKAIQREALRPIRHGSREDGSHLMSALLDAISRLRTEVCTLHSELTRYELVVWTAGNVSARVPGKELMVIKPSGVSYDELTPRVPGGGEALNSR